MLFRIRGWRRTLHLQHDSHRSCAKEVAGGCPFGSLVKDSCRQVSAEDWIDKACASRGRGPGFGGFRRERRAEPLQDLGWLPSRRLEQRRSCRRTRRAWSDRLFGRGGCEGNPSRYTAGRVGQRSLCLLLCGEWRSRRRTRGGCRGCRRNGAEDEVHGASTGKHSLVHGAAGARWSKQQGQCGARRKGKSRSAWAGRWSGEVGSGGWDPAGSLGQASHFAREAEQDGRSSSWRQESCREYTFRERGRRRGADTCRWRSWRRRPCSRREGGGSANSASVPDGEAKEQEKWIGGSAGASRGKWWRRRIKWLRKLRAQQSRSVQEAESRFGRKAGVDQQECGGHDGGRLQRGPKSSWSRASIHFEPGLGGTQEQTPALQLEHQVCLGCSWDTRLPKTGPGRGSPKSLLPHVSGDRSELDRQWVVDFGPGDPAGASCSLCLICGEKRTRSAGAACESPVGRAALGGGRLASQRQRSIHREQEKTWSCREVHPTTRGRRRPSEGRAYAQAKAKVEEQRTRRSSGSTGGRGRSGRVRMKRDGEGAGSGPRILRVPGAGASVVHARIWDLVFSALLRARTGLSSFLHSMLANRAHVQRAQERRVWPMPLPFPEVFRRKKSRDSYEGQRKMGLNFIILVLDWLRVGEQLVSVDLFRLGCPLNKAQWAVVKRLTPLMDSWNSQSSIGPEEMGRCAAKVESVEEELEKLEEAAREQEDEMRRYFGHRGDRPRSYGATGHPGQVVGKLTGGLQHMAKDLDPGRLKFHGVPSFNPVPFLDAQNRAVYERPLDFAEDEKVEDRQLPKVKVRCRPGGRLEILEKLDEVSRLSLFGVEECRKGLGNGLFAIPKDQTRDRMILDARRPNSVENSEKRWIYSLGSLVQFQHLFLCDDEDLYLYAEDLREFYHCFEVGVQRQKRNFLEGTFDISEVEHLGAFEERLRRFKKVVGALRTLAMGDTNAVAFGQVSHLSMILRTQAFKIEDFMTLKLRPSRRRIRAGLMIDDFLVVESRRRGSSEAETKEKVDVVRRAYERYGLPRHAGKAVENALEGEFWGAQLDGKAGRLKPSLKKMIPLFNLLLRVLQLGYSSAGLLEVLTGAVVAAFQLRRRLMASLAEVYAAQRGRDRKEVVQLSKEVKDELYCIAGLLVVTYVDLRLHPSEWLVASDASSSCEAAVATKVSPQITAEFQRHGLQKGLWNRLLSPYGALLKEAGRLAPEDELPEDHYKMHPAWEEAVCTSEFEVFGVVKQTRGRQHINLKEVRAALAAEREVGRRCPDSYYIHLQDSQVSLACMTKGRSSSWELNKALRRSIAEHVGSNCKGFYGYVRSKLNPGDDPTRGQEVRKPIRGRASWWAEIEAGEFENFDAFLEERGCSIRQISELPPEEELYEDLVPDMRTAREVRAERGKSMKKFRRKMTDNLALGDSGLEDEEPEVRAAEARGREVRREDEEVEAEGRSAEAEITEAAERVRTEDENRRTEAESRRAEAESRRTEDEGRRTEAESRRTEAASRRTEAEEIMTEGAETPAEKGASNRSGGVSGPLWLEEILGYKESQFVYDRKKYADLRSAVLAGPGLLDLYSGARGFAKAFVSCGCPWALCFDLKHGEDEDLLLPRIQSSLRRLVSLGSFLAMAAGPVCASFSTAITPAWRTKEHPLGRPELGAAQQLKLQLGHQQLAFALELCELCLKFGVHFWIENPAGSWFWKMPGRLSWSTILATQDVDDFLVDQCRCGTAWRKRTRFRTTSHLGGQRLMCQCKQKHTVLRGRCKEKGVNFTKLAESYPRKLCSILAGAMAIDCGLLPLRRAISVADCVRDNNKRIGEAGNPGPRRAQTRVREVDLDDVQLLEPQTIAMRGKLWKTFIEWVSDSVGHADVDEAISAPDYFVKILEAYGRKLYAEGAPLHYFRQLLAHVQRERPGLRAHMSSAWLLVSRWEVAEPMQHRPPLPEPVVEALISLSICWKWPKCGCCILMAFYGICRIGEVVNAAREDLLTPEDLMDPGEKCYLKIRSPKSRGRGPRIQYATFAKEKYIKFLVHTWQPLKPKEQLFPYSAASFRRRWDALLTHIGISALHRLTPGTLRGGGAVWAHRSGLGIQELLWKMRLQHQKTLGYYLQEVTALSILPLLPSSCRENIAALRELLPLLIEACHSAQERGWTAGLSFPCRLWECYGKRLV